MRNKSDKPVNIGRHKRNCTICAHAQCEEIERDFINWKSPAAIATDYGLADRTTVYRHAHALDLFGKRQRNVRAALERIIERVGEVDVTAAAVVSAIQAHAKKWIERRSSQVSEATHHFIGGCSPRLARSTTRATPGTLS